MLKPIENLAMKNIEDLLGRELQLGKQRGSCSRTERCGGIGDRGRMLGRFGYCQTTDGFQM